MESSVLSTFMGSWKALARLLPSFQASGLPIFFRSNPALSFASREIESIEPTTINGEQVLDITLNFMGLQGASTPLPIHYTERVLQDDPDDSNLNELYNFFNQRLYELLAIIEQKYTRLPSSCLMAYAGLHPKDDLYFPYLHLMLGNQMSKDSFCRIIKAHFGANEVWFQELALRKLSIPTEHLSILGKHSRLGESISLGSHVTQGRSHVELHVAIDTVDGFLPHQPQFLQLQEMICFLSRENLRYTPVFHVKEARLFMLGTLSAAHLGWTSLLGRVK